MPHDSEDKKYFLRQFPLFKDLSDYEIEPLIERMETNMYEVNSFVFLQKEPITDVYFILSGEIKIFRTNPEGKEQIVNILKAPDMFPHQGLFRQGNYPANAQVSKTAQLMKISINKFEEFLTVYPSVSIKMFRILGEVIVDLQNRLEEKMLLTVYEQIVMLLLRLTDRYGKQINDSEYKISLNFTNQDLANMIGSSRETVSRTLSILKKEGYIRMSDDEFPIVNYDQLKSEFIL